MTAFAWTRWLEGGDTRPLSELILFLGKPAADRDQRVGDFVVGTSDRVLLNEGSRSLTEGAGVNLLGNHLDPAITVELDCNLNAAPTGWRT